MRILLKKCGGRRVCTCGKIHFDNAYMRSDIGKKALCAKSGGINIWFTDFYVEKKKSLQTRQKALKKRHCLSFWE
ncbi:MAG: hypothetical protein L6V93_11655 [Clostridiales bacterium]|nr:MAG: hypothetical protein L6V93_11655 [Clostridiales bacterium]